MPTNWNVFYLGNSAVTLDPTEGNNISENAAQLIGQTFGAAGAGNTLSSRIFQVQTINNGGTLSNGAAIMDNDNSIVTDQYNFTELTTPAGDPVILNHDTAVYYNATLTYTDGTTTTVAARIMQTTSNDLFLVPSVATADIDKLTAGPIRSLTLNSVSNSTSVALVQDRPVNAFVPCLAAGSMVRTANGDVAIEDLCVGDMVETRDHGMQAVRWIGSRKLTSDELGAMPNLHPIRIKAGALGADMPVSDLIVSPQHRMLVRSNIAQKMFATDEVLVAAKQLCQMDGIDIAADLEGVEYFHMLFENHEVIFANGAETESLFTGPEALKGVGKAAREEIFAIFPELENETYQPVAAREIVSGRMGRKLAVRHKQNARVLVS